MQNGGGCAVALRNFSMAAKPLRLAADTNVLIDIEDGVEDVLDALDLIRRRLPTADWLVSPSVLDELASLCDSGETEKLRQSARSALLHLRSQVLFRPLLELPFGEELAERIASEARRRGLLPLEEVHDALILAESALLDCSILLTSDEHLRGVDHEGATLLLRSFDLVAPVIATPKEIARKFFR
jgi:predicted nucleic acid-binding protein